MQLGAIFLILIQLGLSSSFAMSCKEAVNSMSFKTVDVREYESSPINIASVVVTSQNQESSTVTLGIRGFQWRSGWSPDKKNLQGDPRNLMILLGDRVASFFKMQMLDQDSMIAPMGHLMSQQIRKANKFLKSIGEEEIAVKFKDSPIDQPIHYLDYLVDSMVFRLPVASDGHFLIHDVALHYGAILLPKSIFENMGQKSYNFMKFNREVEFAIRKYPKVVQEKIKEVNRRMLSMHERRIDVATGNISIKTVDRIVGFKKIDHVKDVEENVLAAVKADTVDSFIRKWVAEIGKEVENLRLELKDPHVLSQEFSIDIFDSIDSLAARFREKLHHTAKVPFAMTGKQLNDFVDQRRQALSKWNGE